MTTAAGAPRRTTTIAGMHIESLNVGRPQIIIRSGRQFSSAINRRPTDKSVSMTEEGLEGDQVSDRRVHGGPDKAICVYPREHYSEFETLLGRALEVPAFGENLTTEGLLESEVAIGDIFLIGDARLQVSQPRQPCGKLAAKHDESRMVAWVNERQFCGFYFRVLRAGAICAADTIRLESRPHPEWNIARALRTLMEKSTPPDPLRKLHALPELSGAWKRQIANRLGGGDLFDD